MKYYIVCEDNRNISNILSFDEEGPRDKVFEEIQEKLSHCGFILVDDSPVTSVKKFDQVV